MLKSIELENFKCFGQRTKISLAPITLIYGQNSAGKSSILQALMLLKQTYDNRENGDGLVSSPEFTVDLGSFYDYSFDHKINNHIIFRLQVDSLFNTNDLLGSTCGVEWVFHQKEHDIHLNGIALNLLSTDCPSLYFKRIGELPTGLEDQISKLPPIPGLPFEVVDAMELSFGEDTYDCIPRPTTPLPFTAHILEKITPNDDSILWADIKSVCELLIDHKLQIALHFKNVFLDSVREFSIKNNKKININKLTTVTNAYVNKIGASNSEILASFFNWLHKRIYLSCYGVLPHRIHRFTIDPFNVFHALYRGNNKAKWFKQLVKIIDKAQYDIGESIALVRNNIDKAFINISAIGPYREQPKRYYTYGGVPPKDLGLHGEHTADILYSAPKSLANVNQWLTRLGIEYQLSVDPIGSAARSSYELTLLDTKKKSKAKVSIASVGYGVSQVLPLILKSSISRGKIITIEQPEIHIHPCLQAELGDLFCDGMKNRNNQFIIETHSEHLVLRIQSLIRKKVLKAEDVSVLYVSRGEKGSAVQQLRLDAEGDFLDNWPGGFFPERIKEVFGE